MLVFSRCIIIVAATVMLLAGLPVLAGGGPQNVLVVVNANSSESLEIGNAYRRARGIPYRQMLTLSTSTANSISSQAFVDEIGMPIRNYLQQQLTDQITMIVLTRGIPRVVELGTLYSTASILAGMTFPTKSQPVRQRMPNSYFDQNVAFSRQAFKNMCMVTMLDGYDARDVRRLIERGITADESDPGGRFVMQSGTSLSANVFAKAADLLTRRGIKSETTSAPPQAGIPLMGYISAGAYSGLTQEDVNRCGFEAGSIIDMVQGASATPDNFNEGQPATLAPVSWFIRSGATGAHGMVSSIDASSAPSAQNTHILLDRYTRGFSLAESFYCALPYLNWINVIIGDPLCAPYSKRPIVNIAMEQAPVKGTKPIRITAASPTRGNTINRVDLYLDDHFLSTVYEPESGKITLRVRDISVSYDYPRGASMRSLLEGMAEAINGNAQLAATDGVYATPDFGSASILLTSRAEGEAGNGIPISVKTEGIAPNAAGCMARLDSPRLQGGGDDPAPAKGALTFITRRNLLPGDTVALTIFGETINYTVPDGMTRLTTLLDALTEIINNNPVWNKPEGVRALHLPETNYISLEARAPGLRGNQILYQLSINSASAAPLRGYPETPTLLGGGREGSAATTSIIFSIGAASVDEMYALDTTNIADGYHRLRAVAYDASIAQTQGYKEIAFTAGNQKSPPRVELPVEIPPASQSVNIPVTASETTKIVEIFLDGSLVGSVTAPPFTFNIPLTHIGRGEHDLWACGTDADGKSFISAPTKLQVIVPPEISRVTPDYAMRTGGSTHRIIGTGFAPGCTVRLAGAPAKSVKFVSPNILEVVSDASPTKRGWVEVKNPDGSSGTLTNSFEYYTPHVREIQIFPDSDVLSPGRTAQFTTRCFDQFNNIIEATPSWDASAGNIAAGGLFTAPQNAGKVRLRAAHPDCPQAAEAQVTIGPAELKDGLVGQWLVAGPFADPRNSELEKDTLPEGALQPSHGDAAGDTTWRAFSVKGEYLDLAANIQPNTKVVGFAHVYLHADAETAASLQIRTEDGIRIRLNGVVIHNSRTKNGLNANQIVPVTLKAGWNRLLIKTGQEAGNWGFYCRLAARDGKLPLTGITYALDKPAE